MRLTPLLLPAAWAALFLWRRQVSPWREAFLEATVLFWVAVAALEVLSVPGVVSRGPVAAAWVVVLAAALSQVRLRCQLPRWRLTPFEAACLVAIGSILGVVLTIAIVSPPNSTDTMAYHLPRVLYWIQAGNVSFFPTGYLNLLSQPPLAEYLILHTYLLSGGDRLANLGQWFGFAGCILAASWIARELGAGRTGQWLAALFCATLPNGILQASGAKNDAILALWLAASAAFALRFSRHATAPNALWLGGAMALAILTKATAYLFAPPLLAACLLPRGGWRTGIRAAAPVALVVLTVNAPHYARNFDLSGSVLGFDSAQGDGFFRWRNERFGPGETFSNLLRHLSEQAGGRSERWNQGVFETVVALHQRLGLDPNDPATTWRWAQYEPPRNANHEVNTHNRWHLLLMFLGGVLAAWEARRGRRGRVWYLFSLAAAFVFFCAYLKWQPFMARMFLPLFVLAAPALGGLMEAWLPRPAVWLICLLLVNNTRPYLFENWIRPWRGPDSIFTVPRDRQYFADMKPWQNEDSYRRSVDLLAASGCERIGIDTGHLHLEYPLQALLRARNPGVRFEHTGVSNPSAKYGGNRPPPCAVACLDCAGDDVKRRLYSRYGEPLAVGQFLLYLPPRTGA